MCRREPELYLVSHRTTGICTTACSQDPFLICSFSFMPTIYLYVWLQYLLPRPATAAEASPSTNGRVDGRRWRQRLHATNHRRVACTCSCSWWRLFCLETLCRLRDRPVPPHAEASEAAQPTTEDEDMV